MPFCELPAQENAFELADGLVFDKIFTYDFAHNTTSRNDNLRDCKLTTRIHGGYNFKLKSNFSCNSKRAWKYRTCKVMWYTVKLGKDMVFR